MPASSHTRVRVLAAGVAFYLLGVLVAVFTGIPSGTAASGLFVAASTWALGVRLGVVALALELSVRFVLFSSGFITTGVSPAALLAPMVVADSGMLLVVVALRRAQFRQAAVEGQLRAKNAELETTLAEVKELRGLLPICAWCKHVRDVDGMWSKLEAYIGKHSHATFTHGICPACAADLSAEVEGLAPTA